MNKRIDSCANRIKQGLRNKKMSQQDLSNITGIPKSAISCYVNGKYTPTQTPTYLIAKALNVSEAWLMGLDVPPERAEQIKRVVTPEEKTFLDLFNRLIESDQKELERYIKDFLLNKDCYKQIN